MNETIKNIVNFINKNGDRFTSEFEVAGTPIKFPQELTRDVIEAKGNLQNYFTELLGKMNADSVTITTKQPNGGTSAGKNPKEKTFTIINPVAVQVAPAPAPNLAGAGGNHLAEGYNFHVNLLTNNLQDTKQDLRDTKQELKEVTRERDKLLVKTESYGEKKKYKEKQLELQQQNSLGSIIKDNIGDIKEVLLEMTGKKGEAPADTTATLEGFPQEKTVLIEVVKALEEGAQLNFYNEIMLRMAQIQGEGNIELLKVVRELTPQCNEHFGIE